MLRKITENNDYIEVVDLMDLEFYEKLSNKDQILICNLKIWKIFANQGLKDSPKVNLYIGKNIMKMDPLVLPVKKSLNSELKENISLRYCKVNKN